MAKEVRHGRGRRSARLSRSLASLGRWVNAARVAVLAWIALALVGWVVGMLIVNISPRFDGGIVSDLHARAHSTVATVGRDVTFFGSPLWLDILFAVVLLLLLRARRRGAALFLILASPGIVAMHSILKTAVDRHRPAGLHLTAASGPSFPSGHACESLALYGALVILVLDRWPRARVLLVPLSTIGLAAIGVSRVVLGVHYPSDVIAGWLLSGGWLIALVAARRRLGDVAGAIAWRGRLRRAPVG